MLLEKNATLTIWQGVIPLRYVAGVVAGLVCRRTTAGRCVITCVLSRRYGGAGCGGTSRIFQQQDIRTISATLLNENGVTEWTPLFYETIRRGILCPVQGKRPAFGGCGRRRDFLLERFAAKQSEQKLTLCDDVAGLSQAGCSVNHTSAGAETECVRHVRYEAACPPVIGAEPGLHV